MLDGLNDRWAIKDALVFDSRAGGLPRGTISTPLCRAVFYLHGAHVAEYQPSGQQPLLFISKQSEFQENKPIRGGVPICFPWFGPHASDPAAPAHGLARMRTWEIQATHCDEAGVVSVVMQLEIDSWRLIYTVHFGAALELKLAIENRSDQQRACEVALHTYLTLADVHTTSVHGLEHQPHLDKLSGQWVEPSGGQVRFTQETDRVYHGPVSHIDVHDPGHHRRVRVEPTNSHSTVVWNPWVEKSQRMPDFGDQEYLRMCCVETANVGDDRLQLAGGARAEMRVKLTLIDDTR